ncbi:Netrin receptor DCC, partial [Nibea albiflora]
VSAVVSAIPVPALDSSQYPGILPSPSCGFTHNKFSLRPMPFPSLTVDRGYTPAMPTDTSTNPLLQQQPPPQQATPLLPGSSAPPTEHVPGVGPYRGPLPPSSQLPPQRRPRLGAVGPSRRPACGPPTRYGASPTHCCRRPWAPLTLRFTPPCCRSPVHFMIKTSLDGKNCYNESIWTSLFFIVPSLNPKVDFSHAVYSKAEGASLPKPQVKTASLGQVGKARSPLLPVSVPTAPDLPEEGGTKLTEDSAANV